MNNGTDVDFEWSDMGNYNLTYQPGSLRGTIEYDGDVIAEVTDIDWGSDALDGQFTGICISNRIFCTHNNYKRNTKTLIL